MNNTNPTQKPGLNPAARNSKYFMFLIRHIPCAIYSMSDKSLIGYRERRKNIIVEKVKYLLPFKIRIFCNAQPVRDDYHSFFEAIVST